MIRRRCAATRSSPTRRRTTSCQEVAVADGIGQRGVAAALKAGKDAAIKATSAQCRRPRATRPTPATAPASSRAAGSARLIEINGTVSVCTPSDAEGVLRRWAEIASRGGGCRRPSRSWRRMSVRS